MESRFSQEIRESLIRMPLLHGIGITLAGHLARSTRRVDYNKGQEIFRIGEPARELFFLLSGQVKRASVSYGGDEKMLELISAGECFGAAEMLGDRAYASFAVTLEPSRLLCIGGDAIRHALATDPRLAGRFIAALANRVLDIEGETAANQFRSGVERVLDYLLQLEGADRRAVESVVTLETRKKLIASRLGMTPETFSRLLRELSDSGLIGVDGRTVTLHHQRIAERQAEMAKEDNGQVRVAGGGGGEAGESPIGGLPTLLGRCATINIAGRQRWLSQRMTKAWLMLGRDVSPVRATTLLNESMRQFEQNMATLVAMSVNDPVRAAHSAVGEAWQPFRAALQAPSTVESARQLFDLSENILGAAENLTTAYQEAVDVPRAWLVNLAARQRMLSQRMAKLFMFLQWGIRVTDSRKGLAVSIAEFELAMETLTREAADQPAILAQLKRVSRNWARLKAALSGPDADPRRHAAAVSNISESLLRHVDMATGMFQKLVA